MAVNDPDMHRTGNPPGSMGRYDPRNTGSYMPYVIGAIAILAVLYMVFGDRLNTRTVNETTVPQTPITTPASPPTPATK